MVALTIATKSGFKEAPPTRDPSISGQAAKSRQFAAVTEPPYNILTFSATSAKTKMLIIFIIFGLMHSFIK